MKVFHEKKLGFRRMGLASLHMFIDRIEIRFSNGQTKVMLLNEIETLSPQLRERIEITHNGEAYRLVGKRMGVSGLPFEIACNMVWKNSGQSYKVSTYFKEV